jgi:hypothetical protein
MKKDREAAVFQGWEALNPLAPPFQNPQPPIAATWLRRNGGQSVLGAFNNQTFLGLS